MSTGANLEIVDAARANYPPVEGGDAKYVGEKRLSLAGEGGTNTATTDNGSREDLTGPNGEVYPTDEDLATLRHVHGKVDWLIYSIGLVEMCERFAYYGTTAVLVNFVGQPLPPGSTTGAGGTYEQAGALDFGQRASTGVSLFNSFWSYFMPVLGGYLADAHWGRFKTIQIGIVLATIGHVIIVISAIPQVIANPSGSLGCFIVGLLFFGTGVGWFKANISPMIAEQYELKRPRSVVLTLPSGERVVEDNILTISRIYMRYYFMVNVGALVGQIAMVYVEKYVGFWLAWLLPTILFLICPIVMIVLRSKYAHRQPTGSVASKAAHLVSYGIKKGSITGITRDAFWERIKPSAVADKPKWMTFDDAWVDEVRRGLMACAVFLWLPLFWLAYNQMNNNLISQAASMRLDGVPNDVVNNLNPFSLLILIPICDKLIYPAIARTGFRLTPVKKIALGFVASSMSMVIAAIIQAAIYAQAPCGWNASDSDCIAELGPPMGLSVWIQTPAYVLIALSEVMASITGLEYAFTKAPTNMRGMVTSVFWAVNALSSALGQAFVGLSADPLLIWLYVTTAILAALGGVGFWFTHRGLDKREDELNALPESSYNSKIKPKVDEEKTVQQE